MPLDVSVGTQRPAAGQDGTGRVWDVTSSCSRAHPGTGTAGSWRQCLCFCISLAAVLSISPAPPGETPCRMRFPSTGSPAEAAMLQAARPCSCCQPSCEQRTRWCWSGVWGWDRSGSACSLVNLVRFVTEPWCSRVLVCLQERCVRWTLILLAIMKEQISFLLPPDCLYRWVSFYQSYAALVKSRCKNPKPVLVYLGPISELKKCRAT